MLELGHRHVVGAATATGHLQGPRPYDEVLGNLVEHNDPPVAAAVLVWAGEVVFHPAPVSRNGVARCNTGRLYTRPDVEHPGFGWNRATSAVKLTVVDPPRAWQGVDGAVGKVILPTAKAPATKKNHQKTKSKFPHIGQGIRTGPGRLLNGCLLG